jgi:CelD/BcsL family acetyltransferase involved in cellulose biosynthesis
MSVDVPGILWPVYEEQGAAGAALEVRAAGDLASLRKDWSALAEAGGNLFSTWEWADCWWRHYGAERRAMPLSCTDAAGRLVAILPLCIDRRRPLRIARFIGHGAADELGPVCAPTDRVAALRALATARTAAPERWSVLVADRLVADHGWTLPAGTHQLRHESSPLVATAGFDWDGYLATRSSNFRSQVRRKERKLQREHGLEYRFCDDPARLDDDLSTLFRLHGARWGAEGSSAFDSLRQAFHRDFARVALERGWLRLWLAEIDGRPVAAWHGFRFGGSEWYYQSGRDPEWERESIGLVLMAHTLRSAIEDGIDSYRLLRGGETYKGRFATGDVGVVTVAVPANALGRAATLGVRAAADLPGPQRRVMQRLAAD